MIKAFGGNLGSTFSCGMPRLVPMTSFTQHPPPAGVSYWQHMACELSFAGRLLAAAVASVMHAVVPPATRTPRASGQEADAPRLPNLGLDTVFGLELIEEFVGRERHAQDVDLPLDRREVAGAQLVQAREPGHDRGRQP
jgi:hypothetical protein